MICFPFSSLPGVGLVLWSQVDPGSVVSPGALQQEHDVHVGAAACQQQNWSSHGKSEESAGGVTGQLSTGKGFWLPWGLLAQ